jgi:hypothetical protein
MKEFESREGSTYMPSLFQSAIACIMFQTPDHYAVKARSRMGMISVVLVLSALNKKKKNKMLVVLINELMNKRFN